MSDYPLSAPCLWMRGGTSKGGYFLNSDLPQLSTERDEFLLEVMGSPDVKQIDGLGGANPLTSKVAVVKPSQREGADVDYLFLQVFVDQATVTDKQNCGNILAGVGPFAIEKGLVDITGDLTEVTVYMENTGQLAVCRVPTQNGKVNYRGDARIDGVPGTASPIEIEFKDTAGSSCGALLPTGNAVDQINGLNVTLIDNGMPVVVIAAEELGIKGDESPQELEDNRELRDQLEKLRLEAGSLMNLGDVTALSVPKMSIVSKAAKGGVLNTRTFIPHRCHDAIGVLGAVSVATACLLEGSPANRYVDFSLSPKMTLSVEHPTGELSVVMQLDENNNVKSAAILRTARKLFDGVVFGH
ncbi:4-oxalomesaconate tautomerase [Vibrio sp. B1FLJ16]|uniref:4-oxalomesaconate tautomerase n=1 Tax=Vibrio sp. B1FLJ16 TaxID=2751178 RepID=UPI0015F6C608|nr:4-oxalomesaconate tautomerase [Vibrio sp. B1FLJ16]CAD7817847.1 (4E)-oxalomesaconate Delta-isomerase [Vibrio sp. B1FLJ16]CAD7818899.1 (4E)-oxalomesaconate Delta-isomerase [Vibrio sp. B1FLJ16]CAE6932466.1 (4E)-oxalomesaconate Delta-isomerase [Vibrio sp. B1FLJ16]CAE6936566.1 (4E)-oxalomesaconate Delta-isomerase [Vibrio sp. B1FLJ16]